MWPQKPKLEVPLGKKLLETVSGQIHKVLAIGTSFCLHFIILYLVILTKHLSGVGSSTERWLTPLFWKWSGTLPYYLDCGAVVSYWPEPQSLVILRDPFPSLLCREVIRFPPVVWVSHLGIHYNPFLYLFIFGHKESRVAGSPLISGPINCSIIF